MLEDNKKPKKRKNFTLFKPVDDSQCQNENRQFYPITEFLEDEENPPDSQFIMQSDDGSVKISESDI